MFSFVIDPHLTLRQFEQRHQVELHNFFAANSGHLSMELDWLADPFTVGDVSLYIQAGLDRFAAGKGFRSGIWLDDQLAGCISLHGVEWENKKASLGYWLGSSYTGRGIITRVCAAVITHSFMTLDLQRIEIQCAIDNFPSRKVADRLGFVQEGILRRSWLRQGQLVDQVVYSLLRHEWDANKIS